MGRKCVYVMGDCEEWEMMAKRTLAQAGYEVVDQTAAADLILIKVIYRLDGTLFEDLLAEVPMELRKRTLVLFDAKGKDGRIAALRRIFRAGFGDATLTIYDSDRLKREIAKVIADFAKQ